MSNHRPRTDPGPHRTTITAIAALALTTAFISAWIIYGGAGLNTLDTRHIVGFLFGYTLAVGLYYKTITLASERAAAQSRIRRFKDLEDAQTQQRELQRNWAEKSYLEPHTTPSYTGQATLARSDTYQIIREDPAQLEPWVTAQTQTRLTTDTAETQPLVTGETAETQVITTSGAIDESAETQPLPTADETQAMATIIEASHQ